MPEPKDKERPAAHATPPASGASAAGGGEPAAADQATDQTADEMEEWVVTIDATSGQTLKIERLDRATGQRSELAEEEYLALAGYDLSGASDYAALAQYDPYAELAAAGYDPYAYEEGYYQAIADYEAMLAGGAEAQMAEDPGTVEAAYYQGMIDYEAALVAMTYGG